MTCCQDKAADHPARYGIAQADWEDWCHKSSKTNDEENSKNQAIGMEAMNKLDEARLRYLHRFGFEAEIIRTDKFFKGNVIVARRKSPQQK